MKNKFLVFFESCKIVKGSKKSIVLDFQRNKIFNIPNSFKDFIDKANKIPVDELYAKYGPESKPILDEYLAFITENELGILLSKEEKILFPSLNISWLMHAHITNCSIELNDTIAPEYLKRLEAIFKACNVQSALFKINNYQKDAIVTFLECITNSVLKNCEVLFYNSLGIDEITISKKALQSAKIKRIYVYNSKEDLIVDHITYEIYYISQSYKALQEESKNNFYPYIDFKFTNYTESQKHNLYFNRKLYINAEGGIMNAPEQGEVFEI